MKAWQKLSITTAAILALSLGAQGMAQADVVNDIVKRGELRVAVQTQGPPVSYVDTTGKRTGFAVELVAMMAEDMGVKLKLLDYDWKGLIPASARSAATAWATAGPPPANCLIVASGHFALSTPTLLLPWTTATETPATQASFQCRNDLLFFA